jgi:hypothetical protein
LKLSLFQDACEIFRNPVWKKMNTCYNDIDHSAHSFDLQLTFSVRFIDNIKPEVKYKYNAKEIAMYKLRTDKQLLSK